MTKIYCDGAGFNGKISRYAIVVDSPFVKNIHIVENDLTSNEMEYIAVAHAMQLAKDGDVIYTDSRLVVKQLNGDWKINFDHLQFWNDEIIEEWKDKPNLKIEWIPRNENLAGKLLEKR